MRTPRFGNALYAETISWSETSAAPRVMESTGSRSPVMPRRFANSATRSGPSSWTIRTAGTFRDPSNARRRVIHPRCSSS